VTVTLGKEVLEGETVDLSLSGILVSALKTFPIGSSVQLSLHLPKGAAPVSVMGSIVRLKDGDKMGIQMDRLTPTESERLQEFLLPLIPDTH
jgi:hypothetical protein